MNMHSRFIACLIALSSLAPLAAALAGPQPATPPSDAVRHFESKIRPLLLSRCVECHGPSQQAGKLRLDSAAGLRGGGSRGAAVLPHDPAGSLLLQAVRHEKGLAMPPGGRLRQSEIADLEAWIQAGAPWPEQAQPRAAASPAEHWSFRPVRRPAIPKTRAASWARNPIDHFILARLEASGLTPAPEADRRTLIRRATFDLTGLPPTPEEIEAFLQDRSDDAWEKVIDRLLLSPEYGEKWGRHWLDVARYADTNGLDENVFYANAWRYRDYVTRSIRHDVPWDRFIREQLAGDLMPRTGPATARHDRLIATGFLLVGPKMISEVDTMKMELDTIDEQIDTTGRAFLGLTLGCARCHDHKFDPITAADYYSLAGIFRSTRFMANDKKPRMWHEHSLAGETDLKRQREHEAALAALKKKIEEKEKSAKQLWLSLHPDQKLPANWSAQLPSSAAAELAALREEQKKLEASAPEMPAAMGVADLEKPVDMHVLVRGDYLQPAALTPRRLPQRFSSRPAGQLPAESSGRLALAEWIASPQNSLTGRVLVNRFWRWHFGRGLNATPDNFGLLGEKPDHPELLDWLAHSFTAPRSAADPAWGMGWSLKRFHRLVMLSSTYRMSSRHDPRAAAVDPENRLLWRAPVQRLAAEDLRDAMLAVSGLLDRSPGEKPLPLKNREYVFDHTSRDATRYESRKRTMYLPVVRNHIYDLLQLFDAADGLTVQGDRPSTTVAPQALFLMNSDLALDCAGALARRCLTTPGEAVESRLSRLSLLVYGRQPAEHEKELARKLLNQLASRGEEAAWTSLAHIWLQSNEFVTLN